jgi:hypothetical protein
VDRNNPPRSSEALIERIQRLSAEAEWSLDELREVLTDAGIDPEEFVKDIKTRIKDLLNASPERPEQKAQDKYDSLPLLAKLRRITGLKATAIAEKMGTPVPFLCRESASRMCSTRSSPVSISRRPLFATIPSPMKKSTSKRSSGAPI